MPRKKGSKVPKSEYTLEVLFFLAADISDKSKIKEIKEKFQRIEKSYNKYVQAVNSNDSDIRQRCVVLRKQLLLFIKSREN